ncbi:molybdenum ABC transporter ATP-binding protein [Gilliamella apicola]|jgi:molybdenum ABC transporter, ATP-binding protein|uniref:Molybdenum ABC transporter ATP-binding protein n=1 Tax=Gilliamella apicola TaxID=1196095 RepID=A0A242NIL9_9GAMM|nr:molybdenum ABC transporter ATP-binding protein [Gilliamella apicola]OCG13943.1 molybdenum ABC transporter ATP-binding protein [Gilliamella apicola]ORF45248.1 molybdenum ABC transporter ATP-binding protein [Gilliamella apicola]ORF48782.1 molybdenum ABC transporter ATP-binding protein [Gilliamella apicola]ORF51257.1 molybdenum ABC transporter ATP-binding protein [Gilliamella apicola]ORF52794.1 molybdenum ABC transporter ATP-binding protein [Gilliamella apicola]
MMINIDVVKQLTTFSFEFKQMVPCQGVTAILGVSGAGKSTLINLINGLIKPDQGKISLNDVTLVATKQNIFVPPEQRNIGTVFQDALLFPHLRVIKNLTYGAKNINRQKFDEIINVLNINHLLKRYPAMLSGGEKQRVAIGRALLTNPKLLLMDEPLSALDMPRKKELLNYIDTLVNEFKVPIIYVTHNINEVKRIANYVVILEQGKLLTYGDTHNILQSDYLKEWL